MSDYKIKWTESLGDAQLDYTVEAPTRGEAMEMYVEMTGAKLCDCGENEACSMCPPKTVVA